MKQAEPQTKHASRDTAGGTPALGALLLIALVGLLFGQSLRAADFADQVEERDFNAATKMFEDLNYERAEREFADFVKTWPNSTQRGKAMLLQARSRHARTNFTGAIELLTTGLPQAGKLADQYQFWLGEARFEAGQFDKAAETYALLVRDFTNSPHRLAATHNEALARFKLGNQREKVVSLLRDPNGAFQRAAKASPTNDLVVSGTLLLGEALLAGKEFPAAEQAARTLEGRPLRDDVKWHRDFLLGRVLTEWGHTAEALPVATNLVRRANALGDPLLQAESFGLHGLVLEKLGELAGAVAAFTNNFSTNTPLPLRHRALEKVVDLNDRQHKDAETVSLLESYSTQFTRDARLDLAQLTLGELRVKEFHGLSGSTNGTAQTNLLATALTNLNFVLLNFTNSPLRGRAHYQRGWCFWHLKQPAPAAADFESAAKLLPKDEPQAMARFKLAEAQALLNDHSNALRNFQLVVEQYGDLDRVRNAYFDEALYRAMRSAWAITNQAAAEAAFRKIIELFPENLVSDKATLSFGAELNRHGQPADARAVFQAQLQRFPKSELAPQIHLAVARTYRQEANWKSAARQYEEWVRLYPTNAARADVEFERAFFSYQTSATNALALFTQFVTNYPAHPSAPQAQFWVGSIHDNNEQFVQAETAYQLLYQSTNAHAAEWRPRALLAAGWSAFHRQGQGYKDATNYFSQLIGRDSQAPDDIRAQAFFALGDTYLDAAQYGVLLGEDPFGDAINAFSRVTNNFPTNPIAARAVGKIGTCQFQRAAKDPKQLELAADSFTKAMAWPGADAETRSLAEVALGVVREKQGRPKDAFEHWSNVLYEKNLKPAELADREATLRTLEGAMVEAGGHMARMREEAGDWRGAILIYQRLQEMAPAKRATLQLRIDRARQMLNGK